VALSLEIHFLDFLERSPRRYHTSARMASKPPVPRSALAAIAAGAAAKAQNQGRYVESHHVGNGEGVKDLANKEAPSPPPLQTTSSSIELNAPAPRLESVESSSDDVSQWFIAHVADKSTLHLHTKADSTRCDLWATTWITSRVLSELLSCRSVRSLLDEAVVVEIGSGSALCSIVAAAQGAHVTVTDSSSLSLTLTEETAKLNGIARGSFSTALLDWHRKSLPFPRQSFDVLLGSDVLFVQMNAPAIADVIEHSLKGGGLAIVLDPGRSSAEDFGSCARKLELEVEVFEANDLVVSEGRLLKLCRLFLLTPKRHAASPRSTAIRKGILEGWQWLGERPRCSGSSTYEYTEKL